MRNKIYILVLSLLFFCTTKNISAQTYQWSKGFGGALKERVFDLTTDNFGNVYSIGTFSLIADFDPGPGISLLDDAGGNIFISVLDMNGNFLWAHNLGGNSIGYPHSVAIDKSGNALITGRMSSDTVDFDPGPGVAQVISNGNPYFFILKLDASGNFIWVKSCEISSVGIYQSSMVTDSSGNIYMAGEYNGFSDFDPGPALFGISPQGVNDVFVLKLDSQGSFLWAKSLGGYDVDKCQSVDIDSDGNVYTAGSFRNLGDFDPGPGVFNLDAGPWGDVFVSKLDSTGNFIWAKNWGGYTNPNHYCWGMTADSAGSVYTTGQIVDSVDFDPGPADYTLVPAGGIDAFISKLDANGNFVWARLLSGTGYEQAHSICVGQNGNVYSAGQFSGITDFNPGPNTYNLSPLNIDGVYLSVLDASGNFVNAIAIDGADAGLGGLGETIAVDLEDNLLITGTFGGTVDFNPPFGVNMTSNGDLDVFIIKYGNENVSISENQLGNGIIVYPNPGKGNYYVDFRSPITGKLVVTNMLGEEIINEKLVNEFSYQLILDEAKGIYFLRIFQEDQCYTVKLIID